MKEFLAQITFISISKVQYNLLKLIQKPSNIAHWDLKKKCQFNLRWIIMIKHLGQICTKVKISRNILSKAQEKIAKKL